jgi:hypothetical protein
VKIEDRERDVPSESKILALFFLSAST